MAYDYKTDTCNTCKHWCALSRQSQFGTCPITPEGQKGPFIMDKYDSCGAHEPWYTPNEVTEVTKRPEPTFVKPPDIDLHTWRKWQEWYNEQNIT